MSEQRQRPTDESGNGQEGHATESTEREPTRKAGAVAAPPDPLELGITTTGVLALAVGTVAIAAAIAIVFVPSLVPTIDATLLLLLTIGGVTTLLGARTVYQQVRDETEDTDPPLVEYRSTTSVPGEDLDANLIGRQITGPLSGYRQQKSVTNRLRSLVVAMLNRSGVDRDAAREMIDDRQWTDRPYASAFFGVGSPLNMIERTRLRVQGDTPFERQAREVIDEVADRLELTDRGWVDPSDRGNVSAVEEGWLGTVGQLRLRDRELGRWSVAAGFALLAVGIGVVVRAPGLLLAATVGVALAAYGYAGSTPTPRLAVTRELDTPDPDPDETVTVTVTVENVGESMLFDLRLFDGVPAGLAVEDGSPRHGTVLQPGATATFSYTVSADRGSHTFDSLGVIARNASGSVERTATVAVEGADTIRCAPKPTSSLEVPVRAKTTRDVGRVVTDTGGSGIEFHSVREYRQGDPLKRIDWNRAARGEGLATLQFNVERSTTVVLLIDTRTEAFVSADREAPVAVERSLGAASEAFVGLLRSDDRVGLATLGPDRCWLSPGAGHGHWALAREMLTDNEAFTRPDPESSFYPPLAIRQLRKRLPSDAQLVFFSPIADDAAVEIGRRLHAFGYPMTVVSPDATGTESPGRTAAHLERRLRLSRLRDADVRVVDWGADEPLRAASERAQRRWSR